MDHKTAIPGGAHPGIARVGHDLAGGAGFKPKTALQSAACCIHIEMEFLYLAVYILRIFLCVFLHFIATPKDIKMSGE